ncbi:Na+/H+ antiporter subunit E [Micropruina sp.]|uniref:Na+/H+ antiporter subunit E n=1 Tax=Micropruina sp. TaxID=2737536 RepID=UPI0039E4A67A
MKGSSYRRRLRFRLQWRAIVVLALVWVVLWGNYSLVDLLVGVAVAWLITVTFPLPPIRYHGRLHPVGVVVLGATVLRDLAVASWRLTLSAFAPRIDFNPAVVRVKLRTNSDLYQVETSEIISIVPGSIVIDARRATRVLYLHLLDVRASDGVAKAKAEAVRVERRVLQAMGSKAEIAALRGKEEQS